MKLIVLLASLFAIAMAHDDRRGGIHMERDSIDGTGCGDNSHWDAWDAKMNITTPAPWRLPMGTVCESLWALDRAYISCKCAPTFDAYNQCVESIIGMTRAESVYRSHNVLSNCSDGGKCCDSYQNCLDLCDAQADMCVSYDKYATFYTNIKATLAVRKAVLDACKDVREVARADTADEGKKVALESCKPVLDAAGEATDRGDEECLPIMGWRDNECYL